MKKTRKEHIEWLSALKNEISPEYPSAWHVAVNKYGGNPQYYSLCMVKAGMAIRRGGRLYILAE